MAWFRVTCVVLLTAACGPSLGAGPRELPPAPGSWGSDRRAGPRGDALPPPLRPGGGYPDPAGQAPGYLVPESRWAELGREAEEGRALAGRGAAFMRGVEAVGPALPVRDGVWPWDAYPLEAGAETVLFATPWLAADRLGGDVQCDAAPGRRPEVRLVGEYRRAGADLLMAAWLEARGANRCVGRMGARDRVRAFGDDLEMFAREVVRRGVPVPVPRS